MAGVFVSYAREDAAKAQAIARALEQASFDVWFDQRIHSGSEYSREIEQALKDAAAVVVLWSRSSVDSAWVRDEAAEGRDSGRLVPVLLDDVRPPIGFRQFQTTDLSKWSVRGKSRQLEEVIEAVAAKAGSRPRSPAKPVPAAWAWWRRPFAFAAVALALVVVAAGAWFFVNRPVSQSTAPSVALLPFTADASDADARKLAAATRDAVAQTLSLSAFSVSTVDAASREKRAAPDFIISGQVTGTPDKFVTTVRMEETAHGAVVFSRQFDAVRAKAWELPERVGAQVASQLSWTAPMIAMEKRHPSDPAVIKTLLQSSTAGMRASDALQDYQNARRLVVEAPNSPLALDQFAMNTAFALDQLPRDERPQAVATARQAAERMMAIAPENGHAYIPWCVLHSEQRRVECENRLRAGMREDPDNSFANWFLSKLLNDVGRNSEAAELANLSLAHDQYMPYKIGHALRMLEVTGQSTEADDLYERAKRWWPKDDVLYWNRFVGFAQRADFESIERLDREVQKETGFTPPPAIAPAVKAKSVSGVRSACAARKEDKPELVLCMLALAQVGDLDGAYDLADRLYPNRRGPTLAAEERIWLDNPGPMPGVFITGPGAAPLRRDLRYLALAERVGLLEYWRRGRLPDFCRPPKPEPICARLGGR